MAVFFLLLVTDMTSVIPYQLEELHQEHCMIPCVDKSLFSTSTRPAHGLAHWVNSPWRRYIYEISATRKVHPTRSLELLLHNTTAFFLIDYLIPMQCKTKSIKRCIYEGPTGLYYPTAPDSSMLYIDTQESHTDNQTPLLE